MYIIIMIINIFVWCHKVVTSEALYATHLCAFTGQYVFWHSSAHILGEAMERHYGGHLCYGPPVEEGFYYDMFLDERYVCQAIAVISRHICCVQKKVHSVCFM